MKWKNEKEKETGRARRYSFRQYALKQVIFLILLGWQRATEKHLYSNT